MHHQFLNLIQIRYTTEGAHVDFPQKTVTDSLLVSHVM